MAQAWLKVLLGCAWGEHGHWNPTAAKNYQECQSPLARALVQRVGMHMTRVAKALWATLTDEGKEEFERIGQSLS